MTVATELPLLAPSRAAGIERGLATDGPSWGTRRLVLCRKVAIYLEPWAKPRLFGMLAGSLAFGGVLLLGRSERLSDPARLGLERAGSQKDRKVA